MSKIKFQRELNFAGVDNRSIVGNTAAVHASEQMMNVSQNDPSVCKPANFPSAGNPNGSQFSFQMSSASSQ